MNGLILQALIIAALAIAAWWLSERFSPDPLLDKLVKLAIFVCVIWWVFTHVMPRLV